MLGAMLPDFASMSRARLIEAEHPTVAAGVAFHHATDHVFHGAPTFVDLYERGTSQLEAAGLDRGPARAVAHVGTELLLDGLLLDDALAEIYLQAVDELARGEISLRFHGDGHERFAELKRRLAGHGPPYEYRVPARVAVRLEQILARRPRLAIGPAERPAVTAFLEGVRAELPPRIPTLFDELRRELGR